MDRFSKTSACKIDRPQAWHSRNLATWLIRSSSAKRGACWDHACLTPPARRWLQLNRLVFEVAFAFKRFGVLVFAQNIFVELHVGPEEILEPGFDPLPIF